MRRFFQIVGTALVEGFFWLIDKRWGDAMFEWLRPWLPEDRGLLIVLGYLWDYGVPAAILVFAVWFFWEGKKRPDVPPVGLSAAPAATASTPAIPISVRNIQHLTNEELRREVGNHADAMRAYEATARGEDPSYARISQDPAKREEQDKASNRHRARVDQYFKTRLLPAAQALDHELRGRLGMGDPLADSMTDPSMRHNAHTIIRGHLAGPSPITDAAGYLEMLARKLP